MTSIRCVIAGCLFAALACPAFASVPTTQIVEEANHDTGPHATFSYSGFTSGPESMNELYHEARTKAFQPCDLRDNGYVTHVAFVYRPASNPVEYSVVDFSATCEYDMTGQASR